MKTPVFDASIEIHIHLTNFIDDMMESRTPSVVYRDAMNWLTSSREKFLNDCDEEDQKQKIDIFIYKAILTLNYYYRT